MNPTPDTNPPERDELFELKLRVLELESALAKARAAKIDAEIDAKIATVRVENRVRFALEGALTSELWGPNGLIAATMRCVHAVQEAEMREDAKP